jgi:hypothetical protein
MKFRSGASAPKSTLVDTYTALTAYTNVTSRRLDQGHEA